MRQLNGCSTPALRSSAGKQWIEELVQMMKKISEQLTTDLQKASYYSMCLDDLDESTDINNYAKLGVILRYAGGDMTS